MMFYKYDRSRYKLRMENDKIIIRRNKEASIARIINAAAIVFSEKGYNNATYTEIANIANLNISLISRYFATKEKLLQATVNFMSSQIKFSFDKVIQKENLNEELHSLTDVMMDNMVANQEEMKAIANIAAHDKNFCKDLYAITETNKEIIRRMKKFYENGKIHKSHDLQYVVDTFVGLVNSSVMFMYIIFGLPDSNVRNRIHYLVEMFINGITSERCGNYPEAFICNKE